MRKLQDVGITTRIGIMAAHLEEHYRKMYPELSLPETESATRETITLPLYVQMTTEEQDRSMSFEQFKKVFDDFGRPKWLGLTGIGSSYLNKDYHKMLAYAKSKGTIVELMDHFAHFKNEGEIRELVIN